MKSSFHSLIPFLPFLRNHLWLPSPELDPFLDSSLKWTPSTELFQLLTIESNDFLCPFITPRNGARRKHSLSIVEKACLLIRCLAIDALFLRAYASVGMCLPSRCLAMCLYVTISSASEDKGWFAKMNWKTLNPMWRASLHACSRAYNCT
jgi:hypothetical protein